MRTGYRGFVREVLLGLLLGVVVAIAVFDLGTMKVGAQDDTSFYACRTDRPDLIEIQFHNFKTAFGEDYWYVGAGYILPEEPTTLYVQALTDYMPGQVDQINFITNGMAIAGNQDYSVEMVGTADTPLCGEGKWMVTMSGSDFSKLPDQNPPPPSPTQVGTQAQAVAQVQVPAVPQPTSCPFMEINVVTNEITCH